MVFFFQRCRDDEMIEEIREVGEGGESSKR